MDNLQLMIDQGLEFAKSYLVNNLKRNWIRVRHLMGTGLDTTEVDCTLIESEIQRNSYPYKDRLEDETNEWVPVWTKHGWYQIKLIDILDVTVLKDYLMINTEGPVVKQQYKGKIADRGESSAQEDEDLKVLGVKRNG